MAHILDAEAQSVCRDILAIMATYHEQERAGSVDTPGGLEHMGDVWKLFGEWEQRLLTPDPLPPTVQRLLAMTDDEIIAQAEAEGVDVDAVATKARAILARAIERADEAEKAAGTTSTYTIRIDDERYARVDISLSTTKNLTSNQVLDLVEWLLPISREMNNRMREVNLH